MQEHFYSRPFPSPATWYRIAMSFEIVCEAFCFIMNTYFKVGLTLVSYFFSLKTFNKKKIDSQTKSKTFQLLKITQNISISQ